MVFLLLAFLAPGRAGAQGPLSAPKKPNAAKPTPKPKEVIPEPVRPAPLPELPPPLAEQALPYSTRFIDRPFTPPKGLHDLTLSLAFANSESLGNGVHPLWYLSEFEYRHPLTNDMSLVWNPIPLGIQYQPKRTPTTLTGVSWSVGWQYLGNIGAKPQFLSYLRHNTSATTAIEMELTYFTLIPFDSAPSIWSGSFRIGPLFQQTDRFAISPRIAFSVDNIPLESAYRQDRTPIEDAGVTTESSRLTFPFSLWMGWAFSTNADLTLEYTLLGSGFRTGTYAHVGTLGLTGRW